jgi:type VI secretion system protein ImpK
MKGLMEDLLKRAVDAGYSQADAQDLTYAVVALADELALNQADSVREYWMGHPLQFQFFQENQAGDGFFTRLEAIRKDASRSDVLRVYYLCLLFGFQGRYRVRGGELELLGLTESLGKELMRTRGQNAEVLSPHGERPADAFAKANQSMSLLYWAGGAVAVALLLFGGLKLGLNVSTSSTIEALSAPRAP